MEKIFNYKEIDPQGHETLDVIAGAVHFNRWLYKTIAPYCKGKVLEIGSGPGNISHFFMEDGYSIFLSDIRDIYCNILKEKFSGNTNLLGIENMDLIDKNFENRYAEHIGSFDTVFALNVVEHIADDALAICNAKKLLAAGGRLIILVPAYQWLYNRFDEELYHYKRYSKKRLCSLFQANDIAVKHSFYFNAFGILGWFVSGKLMKKKTIPKSQMNFYNKIIPRAKLIDKILFQQIGLSVIVVGEKNKLASLPN